MPKSTKRFVITDESVNRYGYRVLTSGIDLSQFEKNPLMLYSHLRADADSEKIVLPIGHWQDIEVSNGSITAVPYFSDNDETAMQIYHKVEEGTIRMASALLLPLEASSMEALMMPGQELPTLTKSVLYEASITDMGVNNNSLALSDGNGVMPEGHLRDCLAGLDKAQQPKNNKSNANMKPELLALAVGIGLEKNVTEEAFIAKVSENHQQLLALAATNKTLTTEVATLKTEIDNLQKAAEDKSIDDMVALAVSEGKISQAQAGEFKALAQSNKEGVRKVLETMPAHTSAEQRMKKSEGEPLLKLSFDELHKKGKLEQVKSEYPEHYKALFKAKYGTEPKA